jgi:diaminopropionate ammonia-lyase
VEKVYVRYEHDHLRLPSFKVLGASWAVNCALADRAGGAVPRTFHDTLRLAASLAGTTLTTATEGNHLSRSWRDCSASRPRI